MTLANTRWIAILAVKVALVATALLHAHPGA
jgi:hypothetical protein